MLFTCLSIDLSLYLYIYLSVCWSANLSTYSSICLSVNLSTYISIYLSIYLPTYLPTYLSFCLSVSIYLSIYLSVCLFIWTHSQARRTTIILENIEYMMRNSCGAGKMMKSHSCFITFSVMEIIPKSTGKAVQ